MIATAAVVAAISAPALTQVESVPPEPAEEPEAATGDAVIPGVEPPEEAGTPEDEDGAGGPRTYLSSSLAASVGRDSGFLVGEEELDDTVYRVTPRLLLVHRPSGRTELLLGYAPELEWFDEHSELDAIHHAGGFRFHRDLTRRSRFLAGGSLLDGEDPTRQLGGLDVVLPRIPFEQSRIFAGLEHRWKLTSALLQLGHTETRIEPGPGALTAGVDDAENLAALTLTRVLGPRTDLSASYTYVEPTRDGLPEPADPGDGTDPTLLDEPVQTLTLGLGHHPTPRVAFHLTGGVLEEDDELSYVGAAEILRRGEPVSIRLRYDRSLLSLGAGGAAADGTPVQPGTPTAALRDTLTDTLSLGLQVRLSDRVRWRQLLEGSRTELPGDETLESLRAATRLVVEATRRLGTFLQVGYLEQRGSDLFGPPFSRVDASVGLIVGLTGPPRDWGVREEPERLDAILPYGREE